MADILRIAVTTGEPAGIGPEIAAQLATRDWPVELVLIGNRELLEQRAGDTAVTYKAYDAEAPAAASSKGSLSLIDVPLGAAAVAGELNPENAAAVVQSLNIACDGCLSGEFAAMVTAPVQKSVINDAGLPFSGHTEYFAERCGNVVPVMMLADEQLRVALVTTHLPLRAVPDAITPEAITTVCRIVDEGLHSRFGIAEPTIAVLGLNPHAGESGHLGSEEDEIITPTLNKMRAEGLNLSGPLPADTAFTQKALENFDAVIAMYHDQGLPVVKHAGFGEVVNITLGLPVVRTSVDHGTALDLAGTGTADSSSLFKAVETAITMAGRS